MSSRTKLLAEVAAMSPFHSRLDYYTVCSFCGHETVETKGGHETGCLWSRINTFLEDENFYSGGPSVQR